MNGENILTELESALQDGTAASQPPAAAAPRAMGTGAGMGPRAMGHRSPAFARAQRPDPALLAEDDLRSDEDEDDARGLPAARAPAAGAVAPPAGAARLVTSAKPAASGYSLAALGASSSSTSAPTSAIAGSSPSAPAAAAAPPAKKPTVFDEQSFPALVAPSPRPTPLLGRGRPAAAPSSASASASAAPSSVTHAAGRGSIRVSSSGLMGNRATTKIQEHLEIPNHQLVGANTLGSNQNTVRNVIARIRQETGCNIEVYSKSSSDTRKFMIEGPPDAVAAARRRLLVALTAGISRVITVPASARPHIVGKGGAVLHAIEQRTDARINFLRRRRPAGDADAGDADAVEPSSDPNEETITITGHFEGVSAAQAAIDAIVAEQASSFMKRVTAPRRHIATLVASPHVKRIEAAHAVEIRLPKAVFLMNGNPDPETAAVVGEAEHVEAAVAELQTVLDGVAQTFAEMDYVLPRQRHRLIGPKGDFMQQVLEATGCTIFLPPIGDASENIVIHGPAPLLPKVYSMILEQVTSVCYHEMWLSAFLDAATDPSTFARFLYVRHRQVLTDLEAKYGVSIGSIKSPRGPLNKPDELMEVKSKDADATRLAAAELEAWLKNTGATFLPVEITIDAALHKYVLGRFAKLKAMPEYESRVVDILMAPESDPSETAILILNRQNVATPDAVASTAKAVEAKLVEMATLHADFLVETLTIDPAVHGRLIGPGGVAMRELLAPYDGAVSVRFPHLKSEASGSGDAQATAEAKSGDAAASKRPSGKHAASDGADAAHVVIKGPASNVRAVVKQLQEQAAAVKHIDALASFTGQVAVPDGVAAGHDLLKNFGWVVRAVRDACEQEKVKQTAPATETTAAEKPSTTADAKRSAKAASKTKAAAKPSAAAPEAVGAAMDLETELSYLKIRLHGSTITLKGTQPMVTRACTVLSQRLQRLAASVTDTFNVFDVLSDAANAALASETVDAADARARTMRALIGREGRTIKQIREQYPDVGIEVGRGEQMGELVLDGAAADVAAVRAQLVTLANAFLEGLHSDTVSVPASAVPHLLGRGGSQVHQWQDETSTRVKFDWEAIKAAQARGDEDAVITCTVLGKAADCAALRAKLDGVLTVLADSPKRTVLIPQYYHRDIIGIGGAGIRKLTAKFGGPTRCRVHLPGEAAISDAVTVQVPSADYDAVVAALHQPLPELMRRDDADAVCRSVVLPRVAFRGITFKQINHDYDVTIWVDGPAHANPDADANTQVDVDADADASTTKATPADAMKLTVVGADAERVDAAVEALEAHAGAVVVRPLPAALLKRLAGDRDVAKLVQEALFTVRGALSADKLELYPAAAPTAVVLRGNAEQNAAVAPAIDAALAALATAVVRKVAVPAAMGPHLIGRNGATLKRLQSESGVDAIVVPKHGAGSVLIQGATEDAVAHAADLIQAIVDDQAARRLADHPTAASAAADTTGSLPAAAAAVGAAIPGTSRRIVPGGAAMTTNKKGRRPPVAAAAVRPQPLLAAAGPTAASRAEAPTHHWQTVNKGRKAPRAAARAVVPGGPLDAAVASDADDIAEAPAGERGSADLYSQQALAAQYDAFDEPLPAATAATAATAAATKPAKAPKAAKSGGGKPASGEAASTRLRPKTDVIRPTVVQATAPAGYPSVDPATAAIGFSRFEEEEDAYGDPYGTHRETVDEWVTVPVKGARHR
ncbi:hypothetical protein CXG81DRAFT_17353 [Caulochytrium protostelioides]|uniref:K Homology domain-containing protein n=1 Tax=Caulochytrium protostelioides TaxID=1555241 RepID=A0A4P9XD37_9FUNG|nr:hypothetical protein CXG81DRAFT_17353 [Caulochytrium protostelioides]|eukprot:RKP03100.1 hypothetical protein CXG81DRAFT_17353 [Caulochytrium protostelioides]